MHGDSVEAPTTRTALLVFLSFATGYFLSYLYRSVNAVISTDLVAEFGLSASALGLLTSAYFLGFASLQIPVGILLDRVTLKAAAPTAFNAFSSVKACSAPSSKLPLSALKNLPP